MHDEASIVSWLREYGAEEFHIDPDFPLDKIDVRKSRENRARLAEPVDPSTVERYVELLKRGEEPPPIVVEDHGDGSFTIIHGNHRDEAARARKRPTLPAYVVSDLNDAQRDLLIYTSNTRNPLGLSDEDRIEQACSLVQRGIMSAKDAAALLLTNVKRVNQRLAEKKADARLSKLIGAKDVRRLATSKRARLNTIHDDPVLVQATHLVLDFKLSGDMMSDLVTKVNALRSESEQLSLIRRMRQTLDEAAKSRRDGRRGPRRPPIVRNLRFVLDRALLIDPQEMLDLDGDLTADERSELQEQCDEAVDRLLLVREAL